VPGVATVQGWRRTIRGDLVAGVAVAAYLVPQCMAYARLAGLDPVRGLWAALAPLVLYALLGTSSRLSVGPESATALLVGSAVLTLSPTAAQRPEVAAALAVAVGVIAVAAWAFRLGFLADLLSRPVLVGYMAGVALTMGIGQLGNLTGMKVTARDTLPRLVEVARHLGGVRPAPLALALGVIAILVALRRFRTVPGPLVAVVAAAGATALFGLDRFGVATVGSIPAGLPAVAFPVLPAHMWPAVFAAAAGISIVAYSDNVLTARAFASRGGDQVDATQEFLALGVANAGAGLMGGFPVSSSGSRTALGDAAGGASQLQSVIAALAVVGVLVVAGPLLGSFPLAALGALVAYAAAHLIDVRSLRRMADFRRSELVIAVVACVGVVAFDSLAGIAVAVSLSVLELFSRVARAHDAVQGKVPGLAGHHDVKDYPEAVTEAGLVVYRYDAPLCFANAEDFRVKVLTAVDAEDDPVEWVILNMEASVEVDLTACDMLGELHEHLSLRGIRLAMARVKNDLAVYLDRAGLVDAVGANYLFPTLPTAIHAFAARRAA
jgi:high affinity sulfate transporter 1